MSSLFVRVALWVFVLNTPFATLLPAYGEDLQDLSKSAEEYDPEMSLAKFRNYLPSQINALTADERSKLVPMIFVGAASRMASPIGVLGSQTALNSLMYDGLADYEGAKRAFQSDLGEEPTGELTVWQIHTLGYRASRINLTHTSFFSSDFYGMMLSKYATVKGTVKLLGERIAYPINHVLINCYREEGTCDYRQIALLLPDEKSWFQSYSVSEIKNEIYKITRWDAQQIDAVPFDNTACRTNQLSFNFETQEFFEIARNNTSGDCETSLGVTLPRLEKPRVSQIVEGLEIINAEFKSITDKAYTFYSSAFRARVEELIPK